MLSFLVLCVELFGVSGFVDYCYLVASCYFCVDSLQVVGLDAVWVVCCVCLGWMVVICI